MNSIFSECSILVVYILAAFFYDSENTDNVMVYSFSKTDELSDAWKDLMPIMMVEKWKTEERKQIIGEEWRKISRIFDRFMLMVLTLLSLLNTLWCLYR